jgi:ribosomal protein S18 acetylase RimI-like enzyme
MSNTSGPEQLTFGQLTLTELAPQHLESLATFFANLPEGDRTFVKEPVEDPAVLRSWADETRPGRRWLALDPEAVVAGFVAVLPLHGWSSHVGELRLVVSPEFRGQGVGARLARHALASAVEMGLTKVFVEVVALQEGTIRMFNALGFRGEALLADHIRDGHGQLQDLVLLAHEVGDQWSGMETVGIGEALG